MELLLLLWFMLLVLWTVYLFVATLNFHKQASALKYDQLRWLERAERLQREAKWKTDV